jgi:MarR family transcriptional regulator, organic hydroperoxide resistance regulator
MPHNLSPAAPSVTPRAAEAEFQPATIFLHLGKAYNAATQAFEALTGVSAARWRLLYLISQQPLMSQKQLVRLVRVDPGSITRQLSSLQREGLLQRSDDPVDTRLTRVELTAAGRAEVRRVMRLRKQFLRQMVRDVSAPDLDTTMRVLDQISANLGDREPVPIARTSDGRPKRQTQP